MYISKLDSVDHKRPHVVAVSIGDQLVGLELDLKVLHVSVVPLDEQDLATLFFTRKASALFMFLSKVVSTFIARGRVMRPSSMNSSRVRLKAEPRVVSLYIMYAIVALRNNNTTRSAKTNLR